MRYNRRHVRMLAALLLCMCLTAGGAATKLRAAVSGGDFARTILQTELGRAVETAQTGGTSAAAQSPEPAASASTAAQTEAPVQATAPTAAASDETLAFSAAECSAISMKNETDYDVDVEALLNQALSVDLSADGPVVLIIHTHTTEAYTPEAGWEYEASDTMRTLDPERSVVRVGSEIAAALEDAGISVLHDETVHDYPDYNGSYAAALTDIDQLLADNPSIQMVLDVHRDAAKNADGTLFAPTTTINGDTAAQVMLVLGSDAGGLYHPNWRGNLACGLKLQVLLNREYPGLARALDLRRERFNEHETPLSMLVEVGAAGNTLKQAITAGRAFGQTLAKLLKAADSTNG